MRYQIFFISDGTGITAENMGSSLLTQFEGVPFDRVTIPYVNTLEKAEEVIKQINTASEKSHQQALIFSTIIDPNIRAKISQSRGLVLDFFDAFLKPLESYFQQESSHRVGRAHGMVDDPAYKARIDALNYALNCDDGVNAKYYHQADVILVGVSRCGKTPTSLYMALQFGVFVANYPFTEDDMENLQQLPDFLANVKDKLFGLTIDPARLHLVRQERRPDSQYASLTQCEKEIRKVQALFMRENIPSLETTHRSVEEIATRILEMKKIKRRFY